MVSRYVSTNKPLREQSPRGKIWVKPTDQMDLWLDSQGYYRKHTAKDGSCLFRTVSEQVFLAQAFHLDVRRHCAEYARRHPELLSNVTHCTVNEYVDQLKHPHEAGGKLELEILSLIYRRDFLVFHEVGQTFQQATDHGFDKHIMLCLSQDHHYDSVYTKQYISNAAFCQSLVYDTLYKGVFELLEVDYAVKKMLHDKSSKYQRDPSSFLMNGLALRLEIRDSYVNVKDLLNLGVTPFPYKVAKSLDPDIYRNVEYDTWNDIRRGLRYGLYMWSNRELQVGVKCLVKLPSDRVCHAHIQQMTPDKGPVLVFVEELGEKMTVPYENLELLPQPPQAPSLPLPLKQLRQLQSLRELSALTQELGEEEMSDKNNNGDCSTSHSSEKDTAWRSEVEKDGRMTPKLKMFSELSKSNKKTNRTFRTKGKDQPQQLNAEAPKHQIEDNTVVSSSSDCNYQQQEISTYQHETFEDYSPQGYTYQESSEQCVEGERVEHKVPETQPCIHPTMLCVEPQHYYVQTAEAFPPPPPAYLPACYIPHKPVLPEAAELPVADIAPLRFYYNCGVDHYPRTVRPTPPCYLNTAVAYMPEPSMSPAVYEHSPSTSISSPDSAVVMSPVGVYAHAQRPDTLPVLQSPGGVSLHSESDSTSYAGHNVAPRFKNKLRNAHGRPYEPPVIQQPEVSSTTNIPVPTHYITPPLYYHPVGIECEPLCPPNYLEYGMYEPNFMYYPSTHAALPPPHYFHPDALFYPHVVAAPLPSAV